MGPTEAIAEYLEQFNCQDIEGEVLEAVRSAITDYVGVILAGVPEKGSVIMRHVISGLGGAPQATVWGGGFKTSMPLAAMANGMSAHAHDYDDTNRVMMSHPSIQLLPGPFAAAEFERRSGFDLMAAYVAGFEVGAKIGRALNPDLVFQGWFPVGTLGILMQTAACAKFFDLSKDQIIMALGIAANLASGLRCNNGSMAKPLMAGYVGHNGILASLFAREGMTANTQALEDKFGFLENFSRANKARLTKAVESLGKPLDIIESGLSYKLYPCCAGTHMPIDCVLQIVKENRINSERIETINVSIGSYAKFLLIHPRPKTAMEGKFSLEYCVARAFLDGEMGTEQFTPAKISDPLVAGIIEKVHPNYFETTTAKEGEQVFIPVQVDVKMKDGTVYSARVEHAKGTSHNPLTSGEREAKLDQCCREIMSAGSISMLKEQLRSFESISDMSEFARIFE